MHLHMHCTDACSFVLSLYKGPCLPAWPGGVVVEQKAYICCAVHMQVVLDEKQCTATDIRGDQDPSMATS